MSESVTRDYSLTVRLSAEEKAALETLVERFDLDKSATVRYALLLAANDGRATLPQHGQFVPLNNEGITIPVRLSGKASDD
jgi:hypothetical protein